MNSTSLTTPKYTGHKGLHIKALSFFMWEN